MSDSSPTLTSGELSVPDGTTLSWEAVGRPDGVPALFLHGGPGSGVGPWYRQHFDPEVHRAVTLDQRGCGRSRPLVTDPGYDLETLTTEAMVGDLEALREHLGIEAWLVTGISWGTTLALAYAQAHPERVTGMVLAAVTTTSPAEVEWITESMGQVFPREWDAFVAASGARPGQRVVDAYAERLRDPEPSVRDAAARSWCTWEDVHVSLVGGFRPSPRYEDPDFRLLFATTVTHLWSRATDSRLLDGVGSIGHVPAVLVHGRLDVSSPLATAWRLHRSWPASSLVVIDQDGHGGVSMAQAITEAVAALAAG